LVCAQLFDFRVLLAQAHYNFPGAISIFFFHLLIYLLQLTQHCLLLILCMAAGAMQGYNNETLVVALDVVNDDPILATLSAYHALSSFPAL
jgi:general stress protein CsbA